MVQIIQANANLTPRPRLTQLAIDSQCTRYPIARITDVDQVRTLKVDAAGLLYAGRRILCSTPDTIADQPSQLEIAAVLELLRLHPPRVVARPTVCSYGLKHIVEKVLDQYCSNGALIVAFSRFGIAQRQDGINAEIQISKRWVSELAKLPRGAWSHIIRDARAS